MAIDVRTVGAMVLEVSRRVGDRVTFGVASGGSASTLVDTNTGTSGLSRYTSNTDQNLIGSNVIILAGPGAGDSVVVSAFDGTSKTITPLPDFSATITPASEYLVARQRRLQDYLEALRDAAREMRSMKPFPSLKEAPDRSIITGSPWRNGPFYLWTAGAAVAPDEWTLSGTDAAIAQESSVKRGGLFSAKVTSNTTNSALLFQTIPADAFKGMTISPKVSVNCDKANRAQLTIATRDEGGTDIATSQALSPDVNWNLLEPTPLLVAENAATIALRLAILADAGGVAVAYWSMARGVVPGIFSHEYPLISGQNLYAIGPDIVLSRPISENPDLFDKHVTGDWEIIKESTRKLKLPPDTLEDRVVHLDGWAYHADLAAVTTTWTGESESLVAIAAANMRLMEAKTEDDRRIANNALDRARLRAVEAAPELPFGWKQVEPN